MALDQVAQGFIQMANVYIGNPTRFLSTKFLVSYRLEELQRVISQFGNDVTALRLWIQRGPNL